MGAVKVVVDPEELTLRLGLPGHREVVVPEELAEDFFLDRHRGHLQVWSAVGSDRPGPPRSGFRDVALSTRTAAVSPPWLD
jgi:hypothetical protein